MAQRRRVAKKRDVAVHDISLAKNLYFGGARPLLTDSYSRAAENYFINDLSVPARILMENAGARLAEFVAAFEPKSVLFLMGKGNNAGDGAVAARHLRARGIQCRAINVFNKPLAKDKSDYAQNYRLALFMEAKELTSSIGEVRPWLNDSDVIVDCIFGIGQKEQLPLSVNTLLSFVNHTDAVRVACDISTGIETDKGNRMPDSSNAFKAHHTVTFFSGKLGQYLADGHVYSGKVHVKDYGFSLADYMDAAENSLAVSHWNYWEWPDFNYMLLPRNLDTHKYQQPCVSIVGGFKGMEGAGELNAMAANSSGAGIVKLFTDSPVYGSPETMRIKIENERLDLDEVLDKASVLLIGSGTRYGHPILEKLVSALEKRVIDIPIILDGGAIGYMSRLQDNDLILTPHVGEFSKIFNSEKSEEGKYPFADLVNSARVYTKHKSISIVLKGATTAVSHGGYTIIDKSGGPELATAGSGDVLAGMIAAIGSRPGFRLRQLALAVRYHALAGRKYRERYGEHSLTASKIVEMIRELGI